MKTIEIYSLDGYHIQKLKKIQDLSVDSTKRVLCPFCHHLGKENVRDTSYSYEAYCEKCKKCFKKSIWKDDPSWLLLSDKDCASIKELEKQTFENIESFGEYKMDRNKYPEITNAYLRKIFNRGTWELVIAKDVESDSIVGCIIFRLDHDFHTQKKEAHVQIFCVDKLYRGKGIGERMLDELFIFLRKNKCSENVSLWHHSTNLSAGDFYNKMGFENTLGKWVFLEKNSDKVDFE